MGRAAGPPRRRAGRAGWWGGDAGTRRPWRARARVPRQGTGAQGPGHRGGATGAAVRDSAQRYTTVRNGTQQGVRYDIRRAGQVPGARWSGCHRVTGVGPPTACPRQTASGAPLYPVLPGTRTRRKDTPCAAGIARDACPCRLPVPVARAGCPCRLPVRIARAVTPDACPSPPPRYMKMEASSTAVSSAGNMLASGIRFSSNRLMPMPMTISPPVAVNSFITAGPSSG